MAQPLYLGCLTGWVSGNPEADFRRCDGAYACEALAEMPCMAAETFPSMGAGPSGGDLKPGPKTRRAQPSSPKRKGPARFQQLDVNVNSGAGDEW